MLRSETGLLSSRRRYLTVAAVLLAMFVFVGALFRNQADPERFPLSEPSSYNPGLAVFRTWWDWSPMSTGDLSPVFDAAQGRSRDADYRMYRPQELEQHKSAFVYTPFAAWLIAPISGPEADFDEAAEVVGFANHLLALIGAAALLLYFFRGSLSATNVLLFAVHVALFYPLAKALHLTQIGVWIFCLFALAVTLFDRRALVASGLVLAAAASLKPHLVLVPVILAISGRFPRRFLVACLAGLLAFGGVSLAYAGFDNLKDYVLVLLPHLSSGYAYAPNQSFNGMLLRLFTDADPAVFNLAEPVAWIKLAGNLFGLALVVTAAFVSRRSKHSGSSCGELQIFALAIAAVVLASPVCWIHHYALLAVPLAILGRALMTTPSLARGGLDLIFLFGALLLSFFFDASRAPALLTGLEFYGALIVLGVSICMVRRSAKQ